MGDINLGADAVTQSQPKIDHSGWRRYWRLLRIADALASARISSLVKQALEPARRASPQSVLLAATRVPGRESDLNAVVAKITSETCHHVTVAISPMLPVGKFDNILAAIRQQNVADFDWLLIIDDDVDLPAHFLDLLLYFANRHALVLAQPAHRFLSYATFTATERRWGKDVRETDFVEIGPVTLLHKTVFDDLLPFPSLRWAWGLDYFWGAVAARRGWKIGVVDAVPIRHLRPVAGSYDWAAALDEGLRFLESQGIKLDRSEFK